MYSSIVEYSKSSKLSGSEYIEFKTKRHKIIMAAALTRE